MFMIFEKSNSTYRLQDYIMYNDPIFMLLSEMCDKCVGIIKLYEVISVVVCRDKW